MPLEATLICIDNSEWMRNGDYMPSRSEAQADAVNLICSAKTGQNSENTVGLMTTAGAHPEVLVTLTPEMGKVLTALTQVRLKGRCHFVNAVQVGQLALKHRQNKSQRQRLVIFVGSPLEEDERTLVRLGKRLKKNSVAVDIISFGELNDNAARLEAFVGAVDSNGNSHLVNIPPGPHILSDILISSPIVASEDGGTPAQVTRTGPGGSFEFVDANLDPELAMAIRISMEEERQRQERAAAEAAAAGGQSGTPQTSTAAPLVPAAGGADDMDEDAMLARALAMSMEGGGGGGGDAAAGPQTPAQPSGSGAAPMETDFESEDAMLARAIAESLRDANANAPPAAPAPQPPAPSAATDQAQLTNMLSSLTGVDVNDPQVQEMIARLSKPEGGDGGNQGGEGNQGSGNSGDGGSGGSS